MKPTELYIFDFDDTLYRSRKPPVPAPAWWYHAHTLDGFGPPGFDTKWKYDVLGAARRAQVAPWAMTVLLTARPQHSAMERKIREVLAAARLKFDHFCLKPVIPAGMTDPQYKAAAVQRILLSFPSLTRVVFYDDRQDNLDAVARVVRGAKVEYVPIRVL
jgi:hypothetical protein